MSVLVKNLGDLFKLILQAFNLSSIFPALVFVTVFHIFLFPILQEHLLQDYSSSAPAQILATLLFVTLVAYFLDAINYTLIRFLEGYNFPKINLVTETKRGYVTEIKEIVAEIEDLAMQLRPKVTQDPKGEAAELFDKILKIRDEQVQQISNSFPYHTEFILPTQFGNVIRAAELYPRKLFGIDAVVLWPFLQPTLTDVGYSQNLLREKAMLDLLINLQAVVVLFTALLIPVEILTTDLTFNLIVGLILKVSGLLLIAVLLYRLSIDSAASWGYTIRTAFILYKDKLREALNLQKPTSYESEKKLWELASLFFDAYELTEKEQIQYAKQIFNPDGYAKLLLTEIGRGHVPKSHEETKA